MKVPGVGDIIGGKYRVEGAIATGGMGIVLRATHLHLREAVAIKILRPDAEVRPESVARFMREARMTMKLRGDHVVRVFDVDLMDGHLPYIVMELLDGEDLALRIGRDGPIAPAVTVDWLLQLCKGVAEAHALGIVHRDLKPANVFVTRDDVIKVLDFGVSKASSALLDNDAVTAPSSEPRIPTAPTTADEGVALTSTKATLGSPRYMSPEQVRSARDVDERCDIWAIGAIAYEMLSGDPPFSDTDAEALRAAITSGTPKSLNAPDDLRTIVLRCLAKDPNERYAHVTRLALALRTCLKKDRRWLARIAIGAAVALGAATLVLSWPRAQPAPTAFPTPPKASATVPSATAPPQATVSPTSAIVSPVQSSSPRARPSVSHVAPAAAHSASDEHLFDNPE